MKNYILVLLSCLIIVSSALAGYEGMYVRSLPAEGSVDMETSVDLEKVLELSGNNMIGMLDPTRGYIPYWILGMGEDYNNGFLKYFMPSHNIGRWWDCMLKLESVTDFVIPADVEAGLMKTTFRFFDNPDHRMYPPFEDSRLKEAERKCTLHDLRENVLALVALIEFRNNEWAVKKGKALIDRLQVFLNEDGTWNWDEMKIGEKQGIEIDRSTSDATATHGRLLEALILFYKATGDPDALKLSERIARYHMKNSVNFDGSFNQASGAWHAHSYLGTLRGLLLYGELTGHKEYIDVVVKSYKKAIPEKITDYESYFCSHNIGSTTSGAETTSPGDIAQLAMWLAKRHGYTELLDDTEQIVRARLVPSQIVECPEVTARGDVEGNAGENLGNRIIGTIGAGFAKPYSNFYSTTDITAAGIHTLIDIYNNITERTEQDVKVYLHFDIENDYVSIKSRRTENANLEIDVKVNNNLWVRMPKWVPEDSVQVTQGDKPLFYVEIGDFLVISRKHMPGKVRIRYDLPISLKEEKINDDTYKLLWRGDEVIGIWPSADFFGLYPTLPKEYRGKEDVDVDDKSDKKLEVKEW